MARFESGEVLLTTTLSEVGRDISLGVMAGDFPGARVLPPFRTGQAQPKSQQVFRVLQNQVISSAGG